MTALDKIGLLINHQLLGTVPVDYREAFAPRRFTVNMLRFATQCLVLVGMDIISLLFYLFLYMDAGSFRPVHIAVHVAKIVLMGLGALYFSRKEQKGYNPAAILDRNLDLLFPLIHMLGEFALFTTGPQELGALIRFLAVPFIVGAIPILSQRRALALEAINYLIYTAYLTLDPLYDPFFSASSMLFNVWGVVFTCAILVSFMIYSAYVANFLSRIEKEEAVEELSVLNRQLDALSRRDPLTGLLNRRGLQQLLDAAWRQRGGGRASVVMIDVDNFKQLNDSQGHQMGDRCLVKLSAAIQKELDLDDYVLARYGGEEFIVVAINRDHSHVVELAEAVRSRIQSLALAHPTGGESNVVTVSLGVASGAIYSISDFVDLVAAADACLYHAKQQGRNRVIHRAATDGPFLDPTDAVAPQPVLS